MNKQRIGDGLDLSPATRADWPWSTMKFTQHNSSPFSTLFSRRAAVKGHLARSGAFIRASTLRLLSHDARNNYDNSTGPHVPLYSKFPSPYIPPPVLNLISLSREASRRLAEYSYKVVPAPHSCRRPPSSRSAVSQEVHRARSRCERRRSGDCPFKGSLARKSSLVSACRLHTCSRANTRQVGTYKQSLILLLGACYRRAPFEELIPCMGLPQLPRAARVDPPRWFPRLCQDFRL